MLVCDNGYYTNVDGASTCDLCPTGMYCDNTVVESDPT